MAAIADMRIPGLIIFASPPSTAPVRDSIGAVATIEEPPQGVKREAWRAAGRADPCGRAKCIEAKTILGYSKPQTRRRGAK
jgi:hypothetical protein